MKTPLKKGDLVVCIDPDPGGALRILRTYTIRTVKKQMVGVTDFRLAMWDKSRFILLEPNGNTD